MRDFNRDRRGSGGGDFKRRDFDRPSVMHQAICSNCGKACEVPFKPNGSKPVFCRECFQNNRTSDSGRSESFQGRTNFQERGNRQAEVPNFGEQFRELNIKLDKIFNLLTVKEPVEYVEKSQPAQTVSAIELPPVIKKKKVVKKIPEDKI